MKVWVRVDTGEQAFFPQDPRHCGTGVENLVREPCRFWSPVAIVSELSRPEGRDHPTPRHPLTRSGVSYARGCWP